MHNRVYRCRKGSDDESEDYVDLTMSSLQKTGLFCNDMSRIGALSWYRREKLILEASCTINTQDDKPSLTVKCERYETIIRLTFIRPHYGGKRWWFLCPVSECGKRVGVLYLGAEQIGCRHCHKLVYVTQYEPLATRQVLKAKRLHCDLGGNGSLTGNHIPPRPKGIHHRTYEAKVIAMQCAYYQGSINMMKALQRKAPLHR